MPEPVLRPRCTAADRLGTLPVSPVPGQLPTGRFVIPQLQAWVSKGTVDGDLGKPLLERAAVEDGG